MPIDVTVEGQGTLPSDVHIALYRITQEALNNVIKHARASQASVALRFTCIPSAPSQKAGRSLNRLEAIGVELNVRDNGRGFEPNAIPPERLGLSIMRERAESVGAQLTVESKVARGTTITVVWHDDG